MFWILFPILVILLTYFGIKKSEKDKTYLVFRGLLIIVLAFVIGYGGIVGQDNWAYALRYSNCVNISYIFSHDIDIFNIFSERYLTEENYQRVSLEFGYELLCYIGNLLHLSYPFFMFLIALLMNKIIVKTIYQFPMPILSVTIYILSFQFMQQVNIIRQMIAVAIILQGFNYLRSNKRRSYLIVIAIAMCFHVSAIVALPLVSLTFVNIDNISYRKFLRILCVVWFLSLLISVNLLGTALLLNIMQNVGNNTIYESYTLREANLGENMNFPYIENFLMLIMLIVHRDKRNFIFMIIFSIGIILMNISYELIQMRRICYYFMAVSCFYSSNILSKTHYYRYQGLCKLPLIITVVYYYGKVWLFNNVILGLNSLGTNFYPLNLFAN